MKPRVSIGMPVRNGQPFLELAVDSILGQDFGDLELIISDNASTDATEEICRAYAKVDRRVQYHRNAENIGAARNYNRTFAFARGEYFKWAAHDDICLPGFLSGCVDVLDRDAGVVISYPKVEIIDENGQITRTVTVSVNGLDERPSVRFHDLILVEHECYAVFGLIRSAALRKTELIGNYRSSDRALLAELGLRGRFHQLPQRLFLRRIHPGISLQANRTHAEVASWFDPNQRTRIYLPAWRLCFEYVRAANRVPLGPRAKLPCYCQIGRWVFHYRRLLARQLYYAARAVFRNEFGFELPLGPRRASAAQS